MEEELKTLTSLKEKIDLLVLEKKKEIDDVLIEKKRKELPALYKTNKKEFFQYLDQFSYSKQIEVIYSIENFDFNHLILAKNKIGLLLAIGNMKDSSFLFKNYDPAASTTEYMLDNNIPLDLSTDILWENESVFYALVRNNRLDILKTLTLVKKYDLYLFGNSVFQKGVNFETFCYVFNNDRGDKTKFYIQALLIRKDEDFSFSRKEAIDFVIKNCPVPEYLLKLVKELFP